MNLSSNKVVLIYDDLSLLPESIIDIISTNKIHLIVLKTKRYPSSLIPTSIHPYIYVVEQITEEVLSQLKLMLQEKYGKLDVFINLTTLLGTLTPIEHTPYALWKDIIQTNLDYPFLLIQSLLNLLKQSETGGHIILSDYTILEHNQAYWGAFHVSQQAQKVFYEIVKDEIEHTSITMDMWPLGSFQSAIRKQALPAETSKLTSLNDYLSNKLFDLLSK